MVQFGTGARLRGQYKLPYPIAGKNRNDAESERRLVHITPDLAAGCGSAGDRIVHFRTLELGRGARTAMPIWALFMQKSMQMPNIKISKGEFEAPREAER